MSIDLDWSALDANLTSSAISFFTNAFQSISRPNFIGEIKVTNFSFGDKEPIIEVLDVRDIYKEFLEINNEEDEFELNRGNYNQNNQQQQQRQNSSSNNSSIPPNYSTTTGNHNEELQQQQQSSSQSNLPFLHSIKNSRPSSSLFSPGLNNSFLPSTTTNTTNSNTPNQSLKDFSLHPHQQQRNTRNYQNNNNKQNPPPSNLSAPSHLPSSPSLSSLPPASSSYTSSPSLQIHLKITYKGNLHIGLSTSLIINYPNENFMNLPLNLNLTSLEFSGVLLIAFEGGDDKRRVHFCFLDPKDEDDSSSSSGFNGNTGNTGGGVGETAGARLLSGAVVESEVGQNEKHVLKNVGKVEKFVLDVARSTLESEMVFPNFQTILF